MQVVRRAITCQPWSGASPQEICDMRMRLQETASPYNLKRGPGGTVDIEFVVQMLQLKHAEQSPQVLVPGTLDALAALHKGGYLAADDFQYFSQSYGFLRGVEARLRLMNTTARHDMPQDQAELNRLAFLLRYEGPQSLLQKSQHYTSENRRRFDRFFEAAIG